jgi:F-type H+-transporting ATPase subunit delta
MSAVIASRYAKALINLAAKDNQVDAVAQGLDEAAALLRESKALSDLMDNVSVTHLAKAQVMKTLLEQAQLPPLVSTFVLYVMQKRRLPLLEEIREHFYRLADERLGRAQADVTVAVPLAADQQQRLKQDLEQLSGKTVTLHVKVDPAILGGAVTRIGSTVWDGSLRNQLNQIRDSIVKG